MKDNNFQNSLVLILKKLFNFSENEIMDNLDTSLFLKPFYLKSYELLYLFFYIEEKFKISFEEEDIINYNFATINNIVKLCTNER